MKVVFNTKIVAKGQDYSAHNGEEVEIIGKRKGKDIYSTRYTIRFQDGTTAKNIMACELDC